LDYQTVIVFLKNRPFSHENTLSVSFHSFGLPGTFHIALVHMMLTCFGMDLPVIPGVFFVVSMTTMHENHAEKHHPDHHHDHNACDNFTSLIIHDFTSLNDINAMNGPKRRSLLCIIKSMHYGKAWNVPAAFWSACFMRCSISHSYYSTKGVSAARVCLLLLQAKTSRSSS
jgi:hypothetical protein